MTITNICVHGSTDWCFACNNIQKTDLLGRRISEGLKQDQKEFIRTSVYRGWGKGTTEIMEEEIKKLSEESSSYDTVNKPKHYNEHPSKIECIQITEHMNFCLGNAMKYIWRADLKNGIEDLQKAVWYLNREIELRRK